jgi:hypothetical protein
MIARLRAAFTAAHTRPWFPPLADPLLLAGFAEVHTDTYSPLLTLHRAAEAASYHRPA